MYQKQVQFDGKEGGYRNRSKDKASYQGFLDNIVDIKEMIGLDWVKIGHRNSYYINIPKNYKKIKNG